MNKVLAFLLRLLAVPWIGIVTGLTIYYQLFICWQSLSKPQFILVCCLVLPLLLLTTPVHELGHVIAARWAKYSMMVISVFGIALHRADLSSPWRIGRTPPPHPPHSVVSMARDGTALRRRHLIVILGGVMMNSLIAILCLGVGQSIFSPLNGMVRFRSDLPGNIAFLVPNTLLIASLNLFVIANLCNALTSLVLTQPGTPPSDGSQILALLREPHIVRSLALSTLQYWLLFGVRPRDWNQDLVAKLQDPGTAATELPATLYLYYYNEDRGETAVAERHLLRAIELFGESRPVSSVLAVEAAYVAGLHHRDGAKAREWLSQVKPEEVEPHARERAEAAALLAEKQFSQAIAMAEQGLESSRKSVDPGGAKAERDWLQAIIDASRQALEARP